MFQTKLIEKFCVSNSYSILFSLSPPYLAAILVGKDAFLPALTKIA